MEIIVYKDRFFPAMYSLVDPDELNAHEMETGENLPWEE
jgi:hypothetical protein